MSRKLQEGANDIIKKLKVVMIGHFCEKFVILKKVKYSIFSLNKKAGFFFLLAIVFEATNLLQKNKVFIFNK